MFCCLACSKFNDNGKETGWKGICTGYSIKKGETYGLQRFLLLQNVQLEKDVAFKKQYRY